MTVSDTSLINYYTQVRPKLATRYRQIMEVMYRNEHTCFTNKELKSKLPTVDLSCITGRVNELRERHGRIEKCCKRTCAVSGNTVQAHKIKGKVVNHRLF